MYIYVYIYGLTISSTTYIPKNNLKQRHILEMGMGK